jgi:hypothetical protein
MTVRRFVELLVISLGLVGGWVLYGVFSASEFYRRTIDTGGNQDWGPVLDYQLTTSLVSAAFTPLVVFIAERLPLFKGHRLRNATLLLAIAPVFSVIRTVLGAMVHLAGEGTEQNLPFLLLSLNVRFHRNVFLFLVIAGITNLIMLQRAATERERNQVALSTAVTNAELQRLRASMQPRMMFATLDAIAERVTTRPEVADRMLVTLGDLLRAMLNHGKRSSVSLAEELEIVDRYFDIERERTDGAFTTRIDVDEELLSARVPPMLLHSLIESALYEKTIPLQHLDISGHLAGGMLALEIRHDAADRTPALSPLEETRARLRQAYGYRASAFWRREGESLVIALNIPVELEASA